MEENGKSKRSKTRTVLSWVLRIALFAAPMYWLSQKVAWSSLTVQAREVGVVPVLGAFACLLMSVTVATWRWAMLLRAYGAREIPSFWALFRHNLVAVYFNLLPSGVGGDAVRGYRLRNTSAGAVASFTVVVVERVCGLVGLMIIAAAAMIASPQLADVTVTRVVDISLFGVLAMAAATLGVPYVLARYERLGKACARIPLVGAWILRVPPAQSVGGLLGATALSVATQAVTVMSLGFLLHPMPLWPAMQAAGRMGPIAILLTYIPVTPGALGQREAVFAYFFGMAGVAAPAAVVASLLYFACLVGLGAMGGVCWLGEKFWEQPADVR